MVQTISMQIDNAVVAKLDALAKRLGCSREALVRAAIEVFLDRHGQARELGAPALLSDAELAELHEAFTA